MNILALDLATRCGWALQEDDRIESGVQTFDVKRGESPGMRYVRFNRWLDDVMGQFRAGQDRPCDLIVYEQTVPAPMKFAGAGAREIAAGFATRVQEFCARRGVEHTAVYPSTLKKWTTGKGNAKKPAMAAAAVERGWVLEIPGKQWDDNEIDAIALLYYAQAELAGPAGRKD